MLNKIFKEQNSKGENVLEQYAKYKKCIQPMFQAALQCCEDMPEIQLLILGKKNKKGKTILGSISAKDCDYKTIQLANKALFKLCAQTESIDIKTSIRLLEDNQKILDKYNETLLEELKSMK